MDVEFSREWSALQDEAIRVVQDGASRSGRGLRVAQFVVMPAFQPNESLDIVEEHAAGRESLYRLVRTVWRVDVDNARFASPLERLKHPRPLVPTIETSSCSLGRDRVEAIRDELGGIVVPLPIKPANAGCDGAFYELRVGWGFTEMSVKWWCEPPAGWEKLAASFHRIVADLRREFDS